MSTIGKRIDEIKDRIERLLASAQSVERIFYLLHGESLPDDAPPENECIIYKLPDEFVKHK